MLRARLQPPSTRACRTPRAGGAPAANSRPVTGCRTRRTGTGLEYRPANPARVSAAGRSVATCSSAISHIRSPRQPCETSSPDHSDARAMSACISALRRKARSADSGCGVADEESNTRAAASGANARAITSAGNVAPGLRVSSSCSASAFTRIPCGRSSRLVDAARRGVWCARRPSTVSGQSMWRVYSANVAKTLRPVLPLWATSA
jgi:hypothetical protein